MFSFKIIFLATCVLSMALAFPQNGSQIPGGVSQLSGEGLAMAKDTLRNSLSKLAAGDGPKYRISKLIWATRQTVSGSLYKMYVELIDKDNVTKKCNVSIWSQPWLPNGIEVTYECDGESKLVQKHDP